ncbi:MAG TPA: transcription termination/antitermination protein NusG [Candidatus Cloacimonadota bacterium]|nr:transcription termination/antitermination protein NusG [Candidatus Cloacimonadota bacterium]HOV16667.1 transcription termination/antitermination protein NusG [Candidatus Cloacimonadota bacterium]HQL15510.1 transcription termination/antitermination protein NusG [Candidatus Cloacimonadota bacterium]
MKWYVVHTYATYENKVKTAIEKGLAGTELGKQIGQILVPVQKTFQIRDGKKVEREKKLFTSYIILEADLTPELITYIRNIAGVTNFLGKGKDPIPLSDEEVKRLLGIADRDKEAKNYDFLPGDMVKVISGPFTDFEGVIVKTSDDGQKLVINVTVFGRITPVELNADQVEITKR